MNKRLIRENIYWLGAVDWDRRLFDSLIPLPDGTTYNAYLIEGSGKTALLDTPAAAYAAFLANALRPKARFLSIVGSYGWGGKTVETLAGMIGNLKVEVIDPVLCKGLPKQDTLDALDNLADAIASKHREQGLV